MYEKPNVQQYLANNQIGNFQVRIKWKIAFQFASQKNRILLVWYLLDTNSICYNAIRQKIHAFQRV